MNSVMTALKLPGVMANLMVKIDPPKVQAAFPLTGCISHIKSCSCSRVTAPQLRVGTVVSLWLFLQ